MFSGDDSLFINHYYAETVYAPLYYGYGESGSFSDRRARARAWDAKLLEHAPDTVLVLMCASAQEIKDRMRRAPRVRSILKETDVEIVLDRFQVEYDISLIHRKFALDTTSHTVEETLQEFLRDIQPYLSMADRLRIATRF
jgi:hypothetical protein